MSPQSPQKVYDAIIAHIREEEGPYPEWYCGVTSDSESRPFNDHGVSRAADSWITGQCRDATGARNVERALLKLGCRGDTGGGDATAVYVYAYRMSSRTNP